MKRFFIILLALGLSTSCNGSGVPEPTEEKEYRASFVAVGDNITYKGNVVEARELAQDGREYDFRPIFSEVKGIIEGADVAFINQETVFAGGQPSYYPMFNSPEQVGFDIMETGFDVVNIANNHMLDKGESGLSRTIDFWKSQAVLMIGGYENAEDYQTPRVIEKNGIRIAFLSYTYGTNGMRLPKNSEIKIPYIEDAAVFDEVQKAKAVSDFVIASVHWGDEGRFKPNEAQKGFAKSLADSGVDVIIGHHPHVIQPVEWIDDTLCVYSLGNFSAEQAYDYNMVGGMMSFDLVKKTGENIQLSVENPIFTPTVFHYNARFHNNRVYLMENYTPELAQKHGVKTYYKHSLSYEKLREYAQSTISAEFLKQ